MHWFLTYNSKTMAKAILLVRVSTDRQEFDIQEEEIYQLALKDGFSDDQIIPIAEKESGFNLKEDERRGLKRMKDEIEKGDVSTVYIWEASRLARSVAVGSSILDYLEEHKVQLILKAPSLKLLNDDLTLNSANRVMIILLITFAEEENRIRKLRMERTRIANSKKGKWNGGTKVMFGYKLDENNYFVINEDEANIVRTIYELYANTDMGQELIRREMLSRGIELSQDRIRRILSRKCYTGQPYKSKVYDQKLKKHRDGYTITLPQIISEELYEKAMEKKKVVNSSCIRKDQYYFARNLLKCSECGYSYAGYKMGKVYQCLAYKHDNKDIPKCHNSNTININVLDTILWEDAKQEYASWMTLEKDRSVINIREQLDLLYAKLEVCESKLSDTKLRYERLEERYIMGSISSDARTGIEQKIAKEEANLKNTRISIKSQISTYEKQLKDLEENVDEDKYSYLINNNQFLTNLEETSYMLSEMYDIVHRFISKVEVERLEGYKRCYWKVKVYHIPSTNPITNETEEEYNIYIGFCRNDQYQFWTMPSKFYGEMTEEKWLEKGYFQNEIKPQLILRKLGRNRGKK